MISTFILATTNPHKVREIADALAPSDIAVVTLDTLDAVPVEPDEDQDTFEGNARLKALYYASATGRPCLAEDSGLEVDALGGAPGVHSARYAGTSGSREERDLANNQKLLSELRDVPDSRRSARFVCALCLALPDGRVLLSATGTYEGVIAREPRGRNGFGYDPLLFLPELGRTSAELSAAEKSERSHRGKAVRLLASQLEELLRSPEGRAALEFQRARPGRPG